MLKWLSLGLFIVNLSVCEHKNAKMYLCTTVCESNIQTCHNSCGHMGVNESISARLRPQPCLPTCVDYESALTDIQLA